MAKRLARYLENSRRVVIEYELQKLPGKVVIWSETDFAGCRLAKRSTSGGVVVFGDRCIKAYSQTQQTVALPSGEAEFYGIVKGFTIGLGIKCWLEDMGCEVGVQVNTDLSAAQSIATRRGAGRVRHIEVWELWVQDRAAKGELTIIKVKVQNNKADVLTKR